MADKATNIILLCEDKQHERFARAFLRERGVERRRIRSVPLPDGRGDAKQWICTQFPSELKAYRAKANHLNNLLIVVTDVDNKTVQQRAETLNQACRESEVVIRREDERVAFILPKWAIETWILALNGQILDENERVEARHKAEAQQLNTVMAEKLSNICKQRDLASPVPSSLEIACHEFQRIAPYL